MPDSEFCKRLNRLNRINWIKKLKGESRGEKQALGDTLLKNSVETSSQEQTGQTDSKALAGILKSHALGLGPREFLRLVSRCPCFKLRKLPESSRTCT